MESNLDSYRPVLPPKIQETSTKMRSTNPAQLPKLLGLQVHCHIWPQPRFVLQLSEFQLGIIMWLFQLSLLLSQANSNSMLFPP